MPMSADTPMLLAIDYAFSMLAFLMTLNGQAAIAPPYATFD
jgi:hypothetical protein